MRIETMFGVTYTLGLPDGMVQPDALGHHQVIIEGEWTTDKMEKESLRVRTIVKNIVKAFFTSFNMKPTKTRLIFTYVEWLWWLTSDEGISFAEATKGFPPAKSRKALVAAYLEVDEVLFTE